MCAHLLRGGVVGDAGHARRQQRHAACQAAELGSGGRGPALQASGSSGRLHCAACGCRGGQARRSQASCWGACLTAGCCVGCGSCLRPSWGWAGRRRCGGHLVCRGCSCLMRGSAHGRAGRPLLGTPVGPAVRCRLLRVPHRSRGQLQGHSRPAPSRLGGVDQRVWRLSCNATPGLRGGEQGPARRLAGAGKLPEPDSRRLCWICRGGRRRMLRRPARLLPTAGYARRRAARG